MYKRIILIISLVGFIGILMVGAVNRTLARTEKENNNQGRGSQSVSAENSNQIFGNSQYADRGQVDEGSGSGRRRNGLNLEHTNQSAGTYGKNRADTKGGYGQARGEKSKIQTVNPAGEGELAGSDEEALNFMLQEEKLARDVYAELYDLWGLPIFQNISQSEQSHIEAVKRLFEGYNLPLPASDEPGIFADTKFQDLYNDFLFMGNQSLADALMVGGAIEEMDILDLQTRLTQTENADIQHVYSNLLQGSRNHLRAFSSTLNTQTGETYQPQFLSQDAYQAIIEASNASSGQGRGARTGRQGRP